MKKIIVLIMSCNDPFFLEQEKYLLHNWIEQLKNFENIDYYFYRQSPDTKFHINKKNHFILVPCKTDTLLGTFEKTCQTLKIVDKLFEYDYIIRTNTSTYLNIPLINSFIQNAVNEDVCYAPQICCAKEQGPYAYGLFPRGNALIISKKLANVITIQNMNKYKQKYPLTYNHPDSDINLNTGYLDDGSIGFLLSCYFIENNMDVFEHFKMFGIFRSECLFADYPYDPHLGLHYTFMNKCMAIQFKHIGNNRISTNEQNYGDMVHRFMTKHGPYTDLTFTLDYINKNRLCINYNGITDIDGCKSVLKLDNDFNKLMQLNTYQEQ